MGGRNSGPVTPVQRPDIMDYRVGIVLLITNLVVIGASYGAPSVAQPSVNSYGVPFGPSENSKDYGSTESAPAEKEAEPADLVVEPTSQVVKETAPVEAQSSPFSSYASAYNQGYSGNVRSFRIFKGWRLLVFSGTLYSGKKRWFATGNWDMPSLGPMGFKVNSVRCYRAHGYPRRRPSKPKTSTNCATFYSDPMWHGSTYTVQKSSAVMRKLNNQVSSFIVKRGWKLTVYEGKGYRGKHHGFRTGKYDRSTLGPIGNDKISSFRCKRV